METQTKEFQIARWESRSGKHYVDLFFNPAFQLQDGRVIETAWYSAPGQGGSLSVPFGRMTPEGCRIVMQMRVDRGQFQPDAAKTPLRRVL